MYSGESRNPWSQSDYALADASRLDSLRKAIREQKILLEAAEAPSPRDDDYKSVQELKSRIITVSQELDEKKQMNANTTGRSHIPWQSRYQQNLRQLEDIADQKKTLQKELDYLVGTNIKNLQDDLLYETERLNSAKVSQASIHSNNLTDFHAMTESERIRAKAQAMVAARLNKSSSTRTTSAGGEEEERMAAQQRIQQVNTIMESIKQIQKEVQHIIKTDLSLIDHDLRDGANQLKDKQMFEQGLFVSDELAIFIDSLGRLARNNTKSPSLPPPPPPSSYNNRSMMNQPPPPPIPTSQRPGTPRSEADIKAEAYRRIEQRRKLFMKETVKKSETNSMRKEGQHQSDLSNEEKSAQERMRQAEADARARLDSMREKRNKIRQEAAETEEKRQKAASEAAAAAEAEMMAEKKRKQQEEEERQARIKRQQEELEEKQRKQRLEEMQRLRKEAEEREKKEAEERQKREEQERAEEELRQKKARQAAEQAAREKRLRREEIERREREMEAARQEEINRRKRWEEEERQRQLEEQLKIQEKLEEEKRIQKRIEEEEAAAKRRKEEEEERERQKLLEEERKKKREDEENILRKERKRREEEQKKRKEEEDRIRKEEEERLLQLQREEEYKRAAESASTTLPIQSNTTTAGTSGYGVDVEDEVNFSIVYRVVTLYEYQGIREDDLSFNANETVKAHPSKDKSSDWWYGTSLVTNQVGFFPRTYVEVVEEAFRVKTLYEFNKTRHDDLEFSENEVILVQPFQEENSEWWYGTNEDTNESGYFPKTYVEKIDPVPPPQIHVNAPSHTRPISIQRTPTSNSLTVVDEPQRGLSAPNTPIMKKTHLNVNKIDITKRRRAASTVSSADNTHVSTPTLFPQSINNAPESLELVTWARTMDPIELHAISPDERKRQEAIFELISTERSYLNDLQMIINIFYTDSGKYLTQDERDVVFSNIDDLLMCNTALLSDMEGRQRDGAQVVDKIGDVFLGHADSLQCYSTYCRNQSYASKFLQKKREDDQWFEVFLKTAQTRPECRSLDLSHFLLQPVQRITRYPLLLRHILNSTPKKHPDYALVKSALSIAQRVLEDVNEETRRFENQQKLSELSRILDMEGAWRLNVPGREIVMDGALYKAKSGRKLHGYLFNDLLILAEPMKTLSHKGYLYSLYREPMPVGKVTVRQQSTMTLKPTFGTNNSDDTSFQIVYDNNIIAVKASSAAQKRQWISQIQHFSALQQYGA
ncbi:hypothetical protein K501DRAFT_206841 [Backusella circina FSU 941]|nr:hypothetical protein K501DRAFT_206841 [Backusella circina FSU 941]